MSPVSTLDLHEEEEEEEEEEDGPHSPSTSIKTTKMQQAATPYPSQATSTPTGGLVDEVDPGSGGAETVEPVALTHMSSAATTSGSSPFKEDGAAPLSEVVATSLEERFVRARSPKVVRELSPSPPSTRQDQEKVQDGEDQLMGDA